MTFQRSGRTDPAAPTVLLSAGLGGLGEFWGPQLPALGERFRVVAYDHRGTGANAEPLPGHHSVDDMAADALDVLAQLGDGPVHFVGHALGGLIGLSLAGRTPERLRSLVLVNAWSALPGHTRRCFQVRLEALAAGGAESYLRAQPIFLYPAAWLEDNQAEIEREAVRGLRHFQGEANLRARIRALEAFEIAARLPQLRTPTLVVAAEDDVLVPVQASRRLARDLPDARLHPMPGGHSCCRTDAPGFNAAMLSFLAAVDGPGAGRRAL